MNLGNDLLFAKERRNYSPADSIFHGQWKIDVDLEITAKGFKWSVIELLDGSPYQGRFKGGTYIHMFLNVNDYHRYHVSVGGIVREIRTIQGKVALDVIKKDDGSLDMIDGTGYQLTQARGLIVIDSPVGLVAVLPIGMGQVSSVNLTLPRSGRGLPKERSEWDQKRLIYGGINSNFSITTSASILSEGGLPLDSHRLILVFSLPGLGILLPA